jgi:hypothetical protein
VRRVDHYRAELRTLTTSEWVPYLKEHSGLPGPRANVELAQAVAEEADSACLDALIATDDEYLVFCGVVGLGRLLAGNTSGEVEQRLRIHATDERWRVREDIRGDEVTGQLVKLIVCNEGPTVATDVKVHFTRPWSASDFPTISRRSRGSLGAASRPYHPDVA